LIPASELRVDEAFLARSTTSQTSTLMISGESGDLGVSREVMKVLERGLHTFVPPLNI
jgi:hypothetical protein